MKSLKSQNYYEILGVARGASAEDIRNAYEVSRHAFQDNSLATYSLFTDEENQEILALISRAYETLFNPELRREYDAFLLSLAREDLPARDPRPALQPRQQAPRAQPAPPRMRSAVMAPPPRMPREAVLREAPARESPEAPAARMPRETPLREAAPEARREAAREVPREAAREVPPAERRPEPERHDEAAEKYIQTVSCYTGPVLKKIRQLRGYSREDIAERTKIRKTYIEYLEEEQFTFLPAPVYVKGFVTMIAGLLNLPAQRVAEDYMAYYRGNHQI
jgi:flagellar biosynthesis protein FlhG